MVALGRRQGRDGKICHAYIPRSEFEEIVEGFSVSEDIDINPVLSALGRQSMLWGVPLSAGKRGSDAILGVYEVTCELNEEGRPKTVWGSGRWLRRANIQRLNLALSALDRGAQLAVDASKAEAAAKKNPRLIELCEELSDIAKHELNYTQRRWLAAEILRRVL